jgi:hypothetical protein
MTAKGPIVVIVVETSGIELATSDFNGKKPFKLHAAQEFVQNR